MKISMTNAQLMEIPDDKLLATYLHELTGQITAIFGIYCTFIGRLALGRVLFLTIELFHS